MIPAFQAGESGSIPERFIFVHVSLVPSIATNPLFVMRRLYAAVNPWCSQVPFIFILSADIYFMHIHINPLHKYDYFKGAVIL